MLNTIKNKSLKLQGSKSILNRLFIIATMMETPLKFRNYSNCEDVRTMLKNLHKLGFELIEKSDYLELKKSLIKEGKIKFFIQDSATGLRFMLARLSVWEGLESEISVSNQLQNRPIKPFLKILRELGLIVNNEFPLHLSGSKINISEINLPADISSQFVSALMLIAPNTNKGLKINLHGKIVSRGYIVMTQKIMQNFGIEVNFKENVIEISGRQKYVQKEIYEVEPDMSSASYFWAIGALSQNWISTKTNIKNSLQTDSKFLNIISEMGAEIKIRNDIVSVRKCKLKGIEIDMNNMPDQVPTLAVIAAFAESVTKIRNILHLQYKESDRLKNLISEMRKIGINLSYEKDELIIYPAEISTKNIILSAHNDHRLAMAFYILHLFYPQIEVDDLNCIKKSNPNFIEFCNSLIVNS